MTIFSIFLTIFLITSPSFIVIKIANRRKIPIWIAWILSIILVWLLIVFVAEFFHYQKTIYLNSFDLDDDGFFSGDEITPEQQQAMQRVSNDTGRALAPITGAIFSFIYNCVLFGIYAIFKKSR